MAGSMPWFDLTSPSSNDIFGPALLQDSDTTTTTDIITGAGIIVFAGMLQGLFTAPMKFTVGWEWENHWLLYALVGCLIMPWLIVAFAVPCTIKSGPLCPDGPAVFNTSFANILTPMGLGFLWGVGGALFGIGCDMVGNSLGFAIILGMCSALGAAIPLVALHPDQIGSKPGIFTWIGLAVVVVGLCFLGAAGIKKEEEQTKDDGPGKEPMSVNTPLLEPTAGGAPPKAKPSFAMGLLVCILSGIFSPMLNVAVNFGKPIEDRATACGASGPNAHNVNWALIVSGGFVVQFFYSAYLLCKNGTWGLFTKGSAGQVVANVILASTMGIFWFSGNVLYTVGATKMGDLGTIAGWPMLMVCMVLTANLFAYFTGEWKGTTSGTKFKLVIGLAVLVLAAVVGQMGGSVKSTTESDPYVTRKAYDNDKCQDSHATTTTTWGIPKGSMACPAKHYCVETPNNKMDMTEVWGLGGAIRGANTTTSYTMFSQLDCTNGTGTILMQSCDDSACSKKCTKALPVPRGCKKNAQTHKYETWVLDTCK